MLHLISVENNIKLLLTQSIVARHAPKLIYIINAEACLDNRFSHSSGKSTSRIVSFCCITAMV